MGFFRQQEERLAARFLQWQYEKIGARPPEPAELNRQARTIVAEAHRIVRQRGGNVMTIVKEMAAELMTKR